jgi:hypothetical protein
MRRFTEVLTEVVTWVLFFIAAALLFRQTWYAAQQMQPDYSTVQAAYIVAGIVTATWLAMLARLVLELDKTPVDWFISLSLLIAGLLIDIAVGLSVVMEFTFPSHLALLVIVAHVVAHVGQWVVIAAGKAKRRFSKGYVSPQQENAMLKQRLALVEQTQALVEQTFEERCNICGEVFEHHSKASAKRALRAHAGRKHNGATVASVNGHKQRETVE